MLIVRFSDGMDEDIVFDPDAYFNSVFEPELLKTQLAKDVILAVDKSELLSPYCIQSPILGQIPPQLLSGGTKTVILVDAIEDEIFNASACGNNCAEWLLKAAKDKDRTVRLGYCMEFPEPFQIKIENTGNIVTTYREFVNEFLLAEKGWVL